MVATEKNGSMLDMCVYVWVLFQEHGFFSRLVGLHEFADRPIGLFESLFFVQN